MQEDGKGENWNSKLIQPRVPWLTRPTLPADLGKDLCSVMLDRDNMLEDVNYQKVVPNRFIVEVNPENFARNYQPLAAHVIQQWQVKLSECLATANSRLGRKEYLLSGRLRIEIRAAPDLLPHQARILSQIQPDRRAAPIQPGRGVSTGATPGTANPPPPEAHNQPPRQACLELLSDGRRWLLYPGVMTLGRLESCNIALSDPEVQNRRLVSGQHAYLQVENGHARLFDGSPGGRPSLNGTYVNRQRVYENGVELRDGDVIILAATDPADPRSDTPGVATFRFWANCNR